MVFSTVAGSVGSWVAGDVVWVGMAGSVSVCSVGGWLVPAGLPAQALRMIKNRLDIATKKIKRLLILVSLKKSIDYNGSHAAENMTLKQAY
jgi:hypothetical protein